MAESITVEPFSFFKIILQKTLQDKKLRIPGKFVKKFGDELCDVAALRVANGCVWKVGLTREGRKIWFNDGWHDFVKDHSILNEYFLVFEYAKNSTFDVLIFDKTACEIEYQCTCEEPENEEQKDGKKIKLRKAAYEGGVDSSDDEHEFAAVLEEMGIYISGGNKFLSVEERQRVICAVRLFQLENPSFLCIMGSTTVHNYVYVPPKFANKYLNKFNESIKIKDTDGRVWPVNLAWSGWCGIRRGWPAFSKDKDLKVGDICLFELIRTEGVLFKVSMLCLKHASLE